MPYQVIGNLLICLKSRFQPKHDGQLSTLWLPFFSRQYQDYLKTNRVTMYLLGEEMQIILKVDLNYSIGSLEIHVVTSIPDENLSLQMCNFHCMVWMTEWYTNTLLTRDEGRQEGMGFYLAFNSLGHIAM